MEFLDREFAQDSRHELLTAAQEVLLCTLPPHSLCKLAASLTQKLTACAGAEQNT